MRVQLRHSLALILVLSTVSLHAATDWVTSPAPYAKALAEQTIDSQPDLLDAIFHVTPPGTNQNFAVAANTAKEQGSPSGADDLSVIASGKPLVEVQKDGVRMGVVLPLYDHGLNTIGALGLMYRYHPGDDQAGFLKRSQQIRDRLARDIPSREALFRGK